MFKKVKAFFANLFISKQRGDQSETQPLLHSESEESNHESTKAPPTQPIQLTEKEGLELESVIVIENLQAVGLSL